MYRRAEYNILLERILESSGGIHGVTGPRQTGKTTMVKQVVEALENRGYGCVYHSADFPAPGTAVQINREWSVTRGLKSSGKVVLVLDEVRKITGWVDAVSSLWEQEKDRADRLCVILVDSSPFSVQETEQLDFKPIRFGHWSFHEMREAFGYTIGEFLVYGGYPGGAELAGNYSKWQDFMLNSLIETTVSRDILMLNRVEKPVVLRNLFALACENPCSVISYTSMMAELQYTGNTTTLSGYLGLLKGAGLVAGLEKYTGSVERQRGSSPKLLPLDTSMVCAVKGITVESMETRQHVENSLFLTAIGTSVYAKASSEQQGDLFYWKTVDGRVDFVYRGSESVFGIHVCQSGEECSRKGIELFSTLYPSAKTVLLGGAELPLDQAL